MTTSNCPWRKMLVVCLLMFFSAAFLFGPHFTNAAVLSRVAALKKARIESEKTPEKKQPALLPHIKPKSLDALNAATPSVSRENAQGASLESGALESEENLIANPSLESPGTAGRPANWNKGGFGINSRNLTYPVLGRNGGKAIKVDISSYQSGDAKWYFDDVAITPSHEYKFSDYYSSNVESYITARFKRADGTFSYQQLKTVPPSASFSYVETDFTAPANTLSVTIFHLIESVGSLTTDDFSLIQIGEETPPSPPEQDNFVPNGNFENSSAGGSPSSWLKGGWGSNTRNFSYPVPGVNDSKAAAVTIASYQSGDAKWYFSPVSLTPGLYTYADAFKSNVTSYITAQFTHVNGSVSYRDLASVAPSPNFAAVSYDFTVPSDVRYVAVFHLIKSIGTLTIDNVSIKSKTPSGIFGTGAVTLRFDDARISQYQNVIPKLNSLGLKATFYIVSRQIADTGFPGYMSKTQIIDTYNDGHEIGAHTRTHRDLTTLSSADQKNEIEGSRQDLLSWNVGPVLTFSYPFGAYDSASIQLVKDSGFTSAAATIGGYVTPTSDRYQLERLSVENTTSIDTIKEWIDTAIETKQWLILTFHSVDNSGTRYSTTPAIFNQAMDYLASNNIPVIKMSDGAQALQ